MAGIGRPEKFFETLYAMGARVVARRSFADHHRYTAAELDEVLADAGRQNALPVTTTKDWVRLPEAYRDRFDVVQVVLDWENEEAVRRLLMRAVGR
jgi:tetraacyldisaccharide 4'-kinase